MRILSFAYLALAYVFILLPVLVLVAFSFQDVRLPVPPFKGITGEWYAKVLANDDLTAALLNSLLVAVIVALILGFLAAHALARGRLPGAALMRAVLIAPLTFGYLIIALGRLNLIGGFADPGAGRILIGGRDMGGVAPKKPADNDRVSGPCAVTPYVLARKRGFGLRMRGMGRQARGAKADARIALVGPDGSGSAWHWPARWRSN